MWADPFLQAAVPGADETEKEEHKKRRGCESLRFASLFRSRLWAAPRDHFFLTASA